MVKWGGVMVWWDGVGHGGVGWDLMKDLDLLSASECQLWLGYSATLPSLLLQRKHALNINSLHDHINSPILDFGSIKLGPWGLRHLGLSSSRHAAILFHLFLNVKICCHNCVLKK